MKVSDVDVLDYQGVVKSHSSLYRLSSSSSQNFQFAFLVYIFLQLIMQTQRSRRGCIHHFITCKHLWLNDLKKEAHRLKNPYLFKENIPEYPRPEFHVSRLKHNTERGALCWIRTDHGFKDPHRGFSDPRKRPLVWWSLAVGPEEIQSAEARLLKKIYPNRTKEQAAVQQSFLWKFATSPAFSEKSRLGSYRFTFPLEEVLKAYSQQFCSGDPPIMRVFRTSLYKQEVQYAVLVHSPANQERFSEFPLLPDDDPNAVCAYKEGRFIWRPEAMCETHRFELIHRTDEKLMDTWELSRRERQFYVWDNVAVALHVESGQVLKFDVDRLRENLTFCQEDKVRIPPKFYFDHFENANILVNSLWPNSPPLEEEPSLLEGFKALFLLDKTQKRMKTFTES